VFNIFVIQLLPLFLAFLGAMLGVAVSAYWTGIAVHSGRTMCGVIIALTSLTLAGTAYLICAGIMTERRVRALSEVIRREIDLASTLEYRARAGEFDNRLAQFVAEIEAWRDRNDEWLRRELPNSGAGIRFRTGSGVVGHGGEMYEYTRLNVLRSNLLSVLDNLPSYVQRSD
jgi:hypothetical protein